MQLWIMSLIVFFFNDTATTEIYTLSLHDALPIFGPIRFSDLANAQSSISALRIASMPPALRSEEHTSELQSQSNLVCRLLLEKKKFSNSRCACSSSSFLGIACGPESLRLSHAS